MNMYTAQYAFTCMGFPPLHYEHGVVGILRKATLYERVSRGLMEPRCWVIINLLGCVIINLLLCHYKPTVASL